MTLDDALQITGLRFRYPGDSAEGAWSLRIEALSIGPGEQMLMQGGSGRGKSTLLHLIAGLIDPDEGEVRVDGTNIHALRGAERDLFRGEKIGMVFQTFHLLQGFTALENVMTAMMFSRIPRRSHRDRAAALLSHLGIDEPDREPQQMSVGQQQRVAVARALACDPILVLADEPTASLDPENATTAIQLLQSICAEKNAALLCVSHDPSLALRFERVESLETLEAIAT